MSSNKIYQSSNEDQTIDRGVFDGSLFNNPMVQSARASMTPEQIAEYKAIGESVYKDVNFETSLVINPQKPPIDDAVGYSTTALQSGMHPMYLTEDEQRCMLEAYGDIWYTRWGYTEEDMSTGEKSGIPDPVTLPPERTPFFGRVARNSKCPCGSLRKFKKCCGNPMNPYSMNQDESTEE